MSLPRDEWMKINVFKMTEERAMSFIQWFQKQFARVKWRADAFFCPAVPFTILKGVRVSRLALLPPEIRTPIQMIEWSGLFVRIGSAWEFMSEFASRKAKYPTTHMAAIPEKSNLPHWKWIDKPLACSTERKENGAGYVSICQICFLRLKAKKKQTTTTTKRWKSNLL